jgi:transposase InsO family protein
MNGGSVAKNLTFSQLFLTHFVYLTTVIDWHTKAILSYKISNSMDATLATDVLKDNGIQISMNGKGCSINLLAFGSCSDF